MVDTKQSVIENVYNFYFLLDMDCSDRRDAEKRRFYLA